MDNTLHDRKDPVYLGKCEIKNLPVPYIKRSKSLTVLLQFLS